MLHSVFFNTLLFLISIRKVLRPNKGWALYWTLLGTQAEATIIGMFKQTFFEALQVSGGYFEGIQKDF